MDKNKTKTFVIALGGNSMVRPKQKGSAEEQYANLERTAEQLLDLLSGGHRIVITHGNGPQVGNLLLGKRCGAPHAPGYLRSTDRRLHGLHDSEYPGQSSQASGGTA